MISQGACGERRREPTFCFTCLTVCCCLILFPLLAVTASSEAQLPRLFRIGTGGTTGVYYPIGKLIAQGITNVATSKDNAGRNNPGTRGIIGVAQNSAGSLENVRKVAMGEIEAGLVQADVASWAFRATNAFQGDDRFQNIRAVASLYSEKFQIVVRRDAGIHTVQDLRNKRISIDEVGSGTLAVMRIVLDAHGMDESDLQPVYLKPVFTHDKLVNGTLQGFVMMAGAPMAAVTRLMDVGISLVPIGHEVASKINSVHPYLVPGRIPAGVYPGIPAIPTLEVYALLIVSSDMDEELVYQVTSTLWDRSTLSLLAGGHPQGKSIRPETARSGLSIPLHPGAERFYREQGFLE